MVKLVLDQMEDMSEEMENHLSINARKSRRQTKTS